jgi:hypothetical protein
MTVPKINDLTDFKPLSNYQGHESDVREIETAKQAFIKKLNRNRTISAADRIFVEDFGAAILEGNLGRLEHLVYSFNGRAPYMIKLVNILIQEMQCSGIEIFEPQLAKCRFDDTTTFDCAVFTIELIRAKRILSIGSHKRLGTHVYGTDAEEGVGDELNEDPNILMKQIGRLATLSWGHTPPPTTPPSFK